MWATGAFNHAFCYRYLAIRRRVVLSACHQTTEGATDVCPDVCSHAWPCAPRRYSCRHAACSAVDLRPDLCSHACHLCPAAALRADVQFRSFNVRNGAPLQAERPRLVDFAAARKLSHVSAHYRCMCDVSRIPGHSAVPVAGQQLLRGVAPRATLQQRLCATLEHSSAHMRSCVLPTFLSRVELTLSHVSAHYHYDVIHWAI
jgi:hypothetical protein